MSENTKIETVSQKMDPNKMKADPLKKYKVVFIRDYGTTQIPDSIVPNYTLCLSSKAKSTCTYHTTISSNYLEFVSYFCPFYPTTSLYCTIKKLSSSAYSRCIVSYILKYICILYIIILFTTHDIELSFAMALS